MQKHQLKALVTTGATVTFVELIESVLNEEFLNVLRSQGFDNLVVQYGNGESAVNLVNDLVKRLEKDKKRIKQGVEEEGMVFEFEHDGVCIRCIQFCDDLSVKYTSKSDLVISHAGTGSIMDAIRRGKPHGRLLVMVNKALQDNHQREIAEAFEGRGVLKSVGDGRQLVSAVGEFHQISWAAAALEGGKGGMVERVLWEEMGGKRGRR